MGLEWPALLRAPAPATALVAFTACVAAFPREAAHATVADFMTDLKTPADGERRMAHTTSKHEDPLLTTALEAVVQRKMNDIPLSGGENAAAQLAAKQVHAAMNHAMARPRGVKVKPLRVVGRARIPGQMPIADPRSWKDVPGRREPGIDVARRLPVMRSRLRIP